MPTADGLRARLPRRRALAGFGVWAGGVAGLGALPTAAQPAPMLVASGSGVNVKEMPGPDGSMVPLRESFAFDAHYAQCVVEDNPAAFVMDTFGMGRAVIEPHTFFMAMYSHELSVHSIRRLPDGRMAARLVGELGCATEAATATLTVGSRTVLEPAFFEVEAVDGGPDGGAAGDAFVFTVFFDPAQAPVNHAIFGPRADFTGELVAGEVTIGPPVALPLLAG